MSPAVIALLLQYGLPLVAQYGLPALAKFVGWFTPGTDGTVPLPTPAQWNDLIATASVTARQKMLATLAAHGIDPASPQGVAFLALTPA